MCNNTLVLCPWHFEAHWRTAHDTNKIFFTMESSPPLQSVTEVTKCKKKDKKVQIGAATWNIHKLSTSGNQDEMSDKLKVINTLFQNNPWLDVLALQEVNSTGLEVLRPRKSNQFVVLSSGPLLEVKYDDIVRYSEYYPLLVSKKSLKSISLANIELFWGSGETEKRPVKKPGVRTYKGEGAPDDIKNRPVVVYTLEKKGCDAPVKIGVVHTSPGYGSQFDRVQIFEDQIKKPLSKAKEDEFYVFLGDYYLPPEARVRKTSPTMKAEIGKLKQEIDLEEERRKYRERYDEPLEELKLEIGEIDGKLKELDKAVEENQETSEAQQQLSEKIQEVWKFYPERSKDLNSGEKTTRKVLPKNKKKTPMKEEEVKLRTEIKQLRSKVRTKKKSLRKERTEEEKQRVRDLQRERKEVMSEKTELENLWPSAGINEVRNVANLTMERNLSEWQSIVGPVSGTNIHGKVFESMHLRSADYCIASGPWVVKCGGMFKDLPLIEDTGSGGCLIYDEDGEAVQNWMKISDHIPVGGYFSTVDGDPIANDILCLDDEAFRNTLESIQDLRSNDERERQQALEYSRWMMEKERREKIQQREIRLLETQLGLKQADPLYSFCRNEKRRSRRHERDYREEKEQGLQFVNRPKYSFDFNPGDFDHTKKRKRRDSMDGAPEQDQNNNNQPTGTPRQIKRQERLQPKEKEEEPRNTGVEEWQPQDGDLVIGVQEQDLLNFYLKQLEDSGEDF